MTVPRNSTTAFSEPMNASANVTPKFPVPVFDGKYSAFKSLFDLLKRSIHNNCLAASQKFQCLKGRNLQVLDQNYEKALKNCRNGTINPRSLIETFLQIPKVDDSKELRKLSNSADEMIRGLRVQSPDAEKRDPRLICLQCKKLNQLALQAWAEHCGKLIFSSLESFFVFVNKRCDALERLSSPEEKHSKLSKNHEVCSRLYNEKSLLCLWRISSSVLLSDFQRIIIHKGTE